MKPETPTPCSNEGLHSTRTTRHAIRRTNVGLKCSSCQRRFPSVRRLQGHLTIIHKNAGRLFCCSKCQVTFDDLSVFLQHSRGHRLERRQQHGDGSNQAQIAGKDPLDDNLSRRSTDACDDIRKSNDINSELVGDQVNDVGSSPEIRQGICLSANDSFSQLVINNKEKGIIVEDIDPSVNKQRLTYEETEKINAPFQSEHLSDHPTMATLASQMHSSSNKSLKSAERKKKSYKKSPHVKKDAYPSNCLSVDSEKRDSILTNQLHQTELNDKNMSINLPHGITSINLLSDDFNRSEIISYLDTVNNKLDAIIRHFNVPLQEISTAKPGPSPKVNMPSQEVINSHEMSNPFWTEDCQIKSLHPQSFLNQTDNRIHHVSSKSSLTDNVEITTHGKELLQTQSTVSDHVNQIFNMSNDFSDDALKIPDDVIERLRSKSLNRGNFAKHLVFHLFTPKERQGKNCFGRRAGYLSGPKAPLNPLKLQAVRKIVFEHYPCNPGYEESIWRRECVIAIDTGLRGENRTNQMKRRVLHSHFPEDQGLSRTYSPKS